MPRTRWVPLCFAVLTLVSSISSPAQATKYWKNSVVTGTWSTGTNWSAVSPAGADNGGAPGLNEAVNIVSTDGTPRTVTYNVSAPSLGLLTVDLTGAGTDASELSMPSNNTLTAKGILIGGYNGITSTQTAGRGLLTQSAGTVATSAGWDFVLGYGANSTGTYTLSGSLSSLTANQSEYVGLFGNGTFNHSAGTNTIATATGFFDIGTYAGSSGTYNLSGTGSLTVKTNEYVGDIGTGVFNQDGGTHTLNSGNNLYIGYGVGGAGGTYTLNSGDLESFGAIEQIGYRVSGTFIQNGGTNSISAQDLNLGTLAGANGTYTLNGGALNCTGETIGVAGTGTFTQTGGQNNTNTDIILGSAVGSTGTYNLSGAASMNSGHGLYIGYNGTGTFNQMGGTYVVQQSLYLGLSAGSSGTYNLNSGSLDANTSSGTSTTVGYDGTGTFNQLGGTSNFRAGGVVIGGNTGSGTFLLSGGSATTTSMSIAPNGVLTVSGSGVLTVTGTLGATSGTPNTIYLSGGTINTAALDTATNPAVINWTSGKLNITTGVTWDSPQIAIHSTATAFGPALALGSNQTLAITGYEGLGEALGGSGSFSLTLNSGSAHTVTDTLTINPTGTITQNAGSTLYAGAIVQAGGAVNGTLQNQTTFTYQSGSFNGRLLNQGTAILGPSFTAGNGVENDASMTINLGQTWTLNGLGLDNQGTFTLAGGTLNGDGPLVNNSVLTGRGTLAGTGGFINNGYAVVSGGTLALTNTGINSNGGQIDVPGGQQLQLTGASLTNTGAIDVAGGTVGGTAVLNNSTGIISGHGTISSPLNNAGLLIVDSGILNVTQAFANSGQIFLDGGSATLNGGSLTNNNGALISGTGRINNNLTNAATGTVRATGNERLVFAGATNSNNGNFDLVGGTLEFTGVLTNSATASISGYGALHTGTATPGGLGITNNGVMQFSGGNTAIRGDVNNTVTGRVFTAGGSVTTFFDDVTNNGQISTIAGARSVFFGSYSGAGSLPGTGTTEFVGDTRPGNSPASILLGGNAVFDTTANLFIELGGLTPGSQYDQVHVTGQLSLGGVLKIDLIDLGGGLFLPAAGNSFDILDWGSLTGTFASISLPALSGTLAWNTSQLYTSGVLSIVSGVPGDYNNNGTVDAADFVLWRKYNNTATTLPNDSTPGTDDLDYTVWRAHFGQTAGGGAGVSANATVPEPAGLVLMLIGLTGLAAERIAAGRAHG